MSLDFTLENVELRGADAVLEELEKRLGERKRARIENRALNTSAKKYTEGLADAISVYADKGYTVEETTHSRASKKAHGRRTVRVGWNGPHKRYKLIHLNEFGYTRWGKTYSPRGMGVIQGYIDYAAPIFLEDMMKEMQVLIDG